MRERLDLIKEGKREYLMSVAKTNYESRAAMSSCTVSAWINKSHPTTTNQTHHSVSNHSQKKTGKAREKLNAAEVRVIDQPKPSRPSDETQTSQGQERVSGHRSGRLTR